MSGVISFTESNDLSRMWFCAGWCFRSVLDCVKELHRGDPEVGQLMEQAKHMHGLHVEMISRDNPNLKLRVIEAIKNASEHIVEGRFRVGVEGRVLPESDQAIFRSAVSDLLAIARRELASPRTST
jgi:hypothetical protein